MLWSVSLQTFQHEKAISLSNSSYPWNYNWCRQVSSRQVRVKENGKCQMSLISCTDVPLRIAKYLTDVTAPGLSPLWRLPRDPRLSTSPLMMPSQPRQRNSSTEACLMELTLTPMAVPLGRLILSQWWIHSILTKFSKIVFQSYTDYSLVNQYWHMGHEIAAHSVT